MSEVVWSVNIMVAILLVAVGYVIYWVFKYDDWNPNPVIHSDFPTERGTDNSGSEELGVRED